MAAATLAASTLSGNGDDPPRVDDRPLGHGAPGVVGDDEVDPLAVGEPADPVDAGDHRQGSGAGVVPARGAGADPGVQPDGEDVDEGFGRARRASAAS